MIVVPPYGPQPAEIMIVGEAPGRMEANLRRPFCGPSGEEQAGYLRRVGLDVRTCRLDNCVREYREGNPDPDPDQIGYWARELKAEIHRTRPKVVIAAGRFAMRWFLGDAAYLDACQGLPHRAGALDPSRADRAPRDTWIVPCTHPASGIHDSENRGIIAYGYGAAAEVIDRVRRRQPVIPPTNAFAGKEVRLDVTGAQLARLLRKAKPDVIAIDTEGRPGAEWSIQIAWEAGTGYVLRCAQPDFHVGIAAIQAVVDRGALVVLHQASGPEFSFYDMVMCRGMKLELRRAKLWDTMYGAYLKRIDPQGLKPLSYRSHGAWRTDYEALLGDIAAGKQLDYLADVMACDWEPVEPQLIQENDGSCRLYSPESPAKSARRIVQDVLAGKVTKDGPADPLKRWKKLDRSVRKMVVGKLGPFPEATLDDVPLDEAIDYSGGDSDDALRVYLWQRSTMDDQQLALMETGMRAMPMFEEMQSNGMPGVQAKFLALRDTLQSDMFETQRRLSHEYFNGKPFNPASPKDVPQLMRRFGLKGTKRSRKTNLVSTSKKSIGHLQYEHDAIYLLFRWRERQKLLTTFCLPLLEILEDVPDGNAPVDVRTNIKTTRVATRRPSSSKPNLLNQPKRGDMSKEIRKCYEVAPGYVLLEVDLSQIELRVAADVTRDSFLNEIMISGRDAHREAAARNLKVQPDQVTDEQRRAAKTTKFGVFYGMGALALRDTLWEQGMRDYTLEDCEDLIAKEFELHPGVKQAIVDTAKSMRSSPMGEVRDMWGMRRYLPAIHSPDTGIANEAARQGFNHRIQGGAQGLILNSMGWLAPVIWDLQDAGIDVRPRLQIYDSLIFSVPEGFAPVLQEIVMEAMIEHCGAKLSVPVKAEASVARSWGEL